MSGEGEYGEPISRRFLLPAGAFVRMLAGSCCFQMRCSMRIANGRSRISSCDSRGVIHFCSWQKSWKRVKQEERSYGRQLQCSRRKWRTPARFCKSMRPCGKVMQPSLILYYEVLNLLNNMHLSLVSDAIIES